MREQYLFRNAPIPEPLELSAAERLKALLKTAGIILAAAVMLVWLVLYFKGYAENRPKNEIELIFEKGFGEYLKKIGREPGRPTQ